MITFIKNILANIFILLRWHEEDRHLKPPNKNLSVHQSYIAKKIPFVIKGGAKSLNAYSIWTDEYLANAFGEQVLDVETSYDGRYNPDSPTTKSDLVGMTFKEYLEDYSINKNADEQYYLTAPKLPTKLIEDTDRPDLLELINSMRTKTKKAPLDVQLFLGNNNNVSPMHTDSYHNFYHMIDGDKEILLIPSSYNLQMKPYIKSNHLRVPDVDNIDFKKYPAMKGIPIFKIHLRKGDLLYIPYGCWHQMKGSKGRNLAIALWY